MKTRRTLRVYGDRQELDSLVEHIEANLIDGWDRGREIESRLSSRPPKVCFLCKSNPDFSPYFVLLEDEDFRLKLADIHSKDSTVSTDQYNFLASEFFLLFLEAPAAGLGLTVDFSSDEWEIGQALGRCGARLLRSFASIPDRSVKHPLDHRRWLRFVAYLGVNPERKCDPWLIRGWLIEQGWAPKTLDRLIPELQFGLELMRAYGEMSAS
jgi:hypothetical protein